MIEERMIPIKTEDKKSYDDDKTPPIEVDDNKMIGLYKTYSMVDIYSIK